MQDRDIPVILCCEECDTVLVKYMGGDYCNKCKYYPSLQDLYIREPVPDVDTSEAAT